jgi:hypothetical protein
MKKITIIKTPKPEVLTKDEIDILFEEYEKSFPIPTIQGLKDAYMKKGILPHEKLIKADSNVDYILIRKIAKYIPPLVVNEGDLQQTKLEKIQYVEMVAKSRIKCYNYKSQQYYYSYAGEKLFVVGFYVPSFSELSKIVLKSLYPINHSLTDVYRNGFSDTVLFSMYYSALNSLDKIVENCHAHGKLSKEDIAKILEYFKSVNSNKHIGRKLIQDIEPTKTDEAKPEAKTGGDATKWISIIDKHQVVAFKQNPMDYIKAIVNLLQYMSNYHYSTKLFNCHMKVKSFPHQLLHTKYDEFYKTKVLTKVVDDDLIAKGQDTLILKMMKEYNKNYKDLEKDLEREEQIKKDVKLNRFNIIEQVSVRNDLNMLATNKYRKAYNKLSNDEKKKVDKDYMNKVAFEKSMLNNNCHHIPIYRELNKERDKERIKKLLSALKKFMKMDKKSLTADEFIKCNVCKFDIICPHLVELSEGVDVKSIITKYGDGDEGSSSSYVCKVCGENIQRRREMEGQSMFVDGQFVMRTFKNDDLTDLVLNEVNYILTTYFKMRHGGYKEFKQFSLLLTDTLLDYIDSMEDIVRKAKTLTEEEKRSKLIMYISVYTFAFLGIQFNKLGISFKEDELDLLDEKKSTKIVKSDEKNIPTPVKETIPEDKSSAKPSAKPSAKSKIVGGRLTELEIHNTILKKLSMHRTMLFTKFNVSAVEEYKKALSRISSDHIEIQKDNNDDVINEELTTDSFYTYLYEFTKSEKLNDQKKVSLSEIYKIRSDKNNPSKVLGISNNELDRFKSKDEPLFASIKPINFPNKLSEHNEYEVYKRNAYKYIVDFTINRRFDMDYKLVEYNAVDLNPGSKEPYDFKVAESKIEHANNIPFDRLVSKFTYVPYSKFYSDPNRGYFYTKSGDRQKFDTVVMKDKSGKLKTFKTNDVPINHGMKVVDFKNSKTGDSFNDPPKVDKNNIDKKIEYKDFLDYYMFNCPKGEVHDYPEGKSKCTKCGFTTDESFNPDVYYNKYLPEFKKLNKIDVVSLFKPEKIADKAPDKLVCNVIKISNFSKKYKLNFNLINNLGRMERQEFTDVRNNKLNTNLYYEKNRMLKLENYINIIIVDYYIILNRKNIVDLPKDITKLLSLKPNIKLKNIDDKIINYRQNMYIYKNRLGFKIDEINNYILNNIIDILEIMDDKEVVKFVVNKILSRDRLYTNAQKLSAKKVQKELDEWIKESEDRSENKLLESIDKEDEEAEDMSGEVKASDFVINFDYEIEDEEDSDMIGDL